MIDWLFSQDLDDRPSDTGALSGSRPTGEARWRDAERKALRASPYQRASATGP